VDFVAMDVKAPLDRYAPFCRQPHIADELATSIGLIQNTAPDYEFRTTCTAPFIDAAAVETIAASIRGARLLVLQRFNRRAQYLDPLFDRSHDPAIPLDEMQRFRALAAPFVARCVLR
jgi:pyruvate formate lyase activating enzyme